MRRSTATLVLERPPKAGAPFDDAPSGMEGAAPPWFASRPPGLCIVGMRAATGWCKGSEPALL